MNNTLHPSSTRNGMENFGIGRHRFLRSVVNLIFGLAILHEASALQAQPVIVKQPQDSSISLGAAVTFSVMASGVVPLLYEWSFNGQPLSNATNRTVTLTNVSPANDGSYFVVVTDSTGSTTSRAALVKVDPTFTKITEGLIVSERADHEGMAWVDYDNDGWLDLFSGTGSGGPHNLLYRNNGNGTFTSLNAAAVGSVVQTGGEDCAWGDYDNDGLLDVFVTTDSGPSALHHNNGNGTFTKITTGPMLNGNGTSHKACAWADYDNDGYIDLFATTQNRLFHNNGDGTFTTVTNAAIVRTASSFACTWVDFNNDGRPDLFASAGLDSRNYLYRNDGNRVFASVSTNQAHGLINTPAVSGVWGDFDNDGYPDAWMIGAGGQHLYRNNRDGSFTEVTVASLGSDRPSSAAGAWADYDNDGYLDLFVSSSPLNFLYHNNGDGTFTKVDAGSVTHDGALYQEDYSCAWGDYDNDGFLDLAVGSINAGTANPSFLYRNSGNANHWLKIRCIGTVSNRAAIGAKVRLLATIRGRSIWQLREITGGGGYGGQALLPHFGLGDATAAEQLRIEWPSGQVTELSNVAAGRVLTIVEPGAVSNLSISRNGTQLEVMLHGTQGVPFFLEKSTDLKTWNAITNVSLKAAGGVVVHQVSDDQSASRLFFRAHPMSN